MSTAAISAGCKSFSDNRAMSIATPRWLLVGTALVVGLAFFVASHDVRVSLAESYTQNADEMEIAASGGNLFRRLAFIFLGGWGCLLLATVRSQLTLNLPLALSIGVLLALAGGSFVWADDPGMCLRRLFSLGLCVLAALGIARSLSIREISWLAIWIFGGLAIIGVLAELALGTFKPWTADYRFAGTVHPNTQGPSLATLCLATFALAQEGVRGRVWLWLVFAIGFGLLLLTKSRSATAGFVIALGALQFVKIPVAQKLGGLVCCGGAGALALWLLLVCGFDPLTDFRDALLLGRAEDSDTLSGRAFIWPELMSYATNRLWLGYGYESFWTAGRIDDISRNLGWGLREAHNAYLEIVLWLGVVGLMSLLLVVIAGLLTSLRQWRRSGDAACLLPAGLLFFGLINAGFESGMVAMTLVPFVLGCLLIRLAFFEQKGVAENAAA